MNVFGDDPSSPTLVYTELATKLFDNASGIGSGLATPVPPHGIIIKTDKEEVFVGITCWGFHLGTWEDNQICMSRLFYSSELAQCLDDYVKEKKLHKFPQIYVDILSGRNNICPECPCPKDLGTVPERHTDD